MNLKSKKVKNWVMGFGFYFPLFVSILTWGLAANPSFTNSVRAQTGDNYDLSHNVIAPGGGSNSAGGGFSVDGTIGQPSAGVISTGSGFSVQGGFWTFQSLAPT